MNLLTALGHVGGCKQWNTNAESRNVCPSVQGWCLWSFESKRQRGIGVSVSLFIGSWSFAAMLLNQTEDICTYFVGKEEMKSKHSESCKYGVTHDYPISCSCSQSVILLIHQFPNQHQDHLFWWVWRSRFSMQDQHLGTAGRTIGTFSAALCSLLCKGSHPYFESVHTQSRICILIAFASFIYCCCLCILKYWSVQYFLWDASYMLPACHKCALISR